MKWECPICGKEFENLGIKEYEQCAKTTLFGKFKRKVNRWSDEYQIVNRLPNQLVCSEECKRKNEEQYFIEEYKGNKIYCVNGRYMPYLECEYWYDSIDGVKYRIDNPHLIPTTPGIIDALKMR